MFEHEGQDVIVLFIGVEDKDMACVSRATYHLARIHDIMFEI